MTGIAVRFDEEVCCLCLTKGDERYTLLFTPLTVRQALQAVGRWAAHPQLSFSWYDAAVLGQAIRKSAREMG